MADRTITLIPGDGIGPEVTRAVVRILEASGFTPQWESFSAGAEAVAEHGTTLPQALLDSITRNKIALKGPITTPIGRALRVMGLRKALDLYASLRRSGTCVGTVAVYRVDRDRSGNTEDLRWPGATGFPASSSLKIITQGRRIMAYFAFEQAAPGGRKVTRCTRPAS